MSGVEPASIPMQSLHEESFGEARRGWDASLGAFRVASASEVVQRLKEFVKDAGESQIRAWRDSVPLLQREVGEAIDRNSVREDDAAVLEYQLPLESRRIDAVFLVGETVVVIELKGKLDVSQADVDQAAAYVRDLRSYHRECASRPVVGILVPTRLRGYRGEESGVHICGVDALDELMSRFSPSESRNNVDLRSFLSESAYRPLPSLVKAARELFEHGNLRRIHRAAAATGPALERIQQIALEAARTKTRHLVLVAGVPGSGKTLVGLQVAHAKYLDQIAIARGSEQPSAPAVFLSGNGPLVEVLRYELRSAGGGGSTFVRGVKEYVKHYSRSTSPTPPEHVLIFDEAQRAWDAAQVASKHANTHKSEPELFIEFAERIPEWCVVVGLIGDGQEIHVGEEGGISQWCRAIERSQANGQWMIHGPERMSASFTSLRSQWRSHQALNLETELRFHLTREVHRWVQGVLEGHEADQLKELAESLDRSGYHIRLCRDFETGAQYLRDRFGSDPEARYGVVASSRDKSLRRFRVYNDFQSTKRIRFGPWFGSGDGEGEAGDSCRDLLKCVTEFGCQGLELDAVLMAWGTDLLRSSRSWSIQYATQYKRGGPVEVRDPFRLRVNAYRVLLTRGRSATVIFVPRLAELEETAAHLIACGVKPL